MLGDKIGEWEQKQKDPKYTEGFRKKLEEFAGYAKSIDASLSATMKISVEDLGVFKADLEKLVSSAEDETKFEEEKRKPRIEKIEAKRGSFEKEKDQQKTEFITKLLKGIAEPFAGILKKQLEEKFSKIEQPLLDKLQSLKDKTSTADKDSLLPAMTEIEEIPVDMKAYLDVKDSNGSIKQFPEVAKIVIDQQEYVSNAKYFINKTEREHFLQGKDPKASCKAALDKWEEKFQKEYLTQNKLPNPSELASLINQADHEIIVGYLVDKINETSRQKITPKDFDIFIQTYKKGESGTLDATSREKIRVLFIQIQPELDALGVNVHIEGGADASTFDMKKDVAKYQEYADIASKLKTSDLWNAPAVTVFHGVLEGLMVAKSKSPEDLATFIEAHKAELGNAGGALNILLAYKRMSATFGDQIVGSGVLDLKAQTYLEGEEYRYSRMRFSSRKEISSGRVNRFAQPKPAAVQDAAEGQISEGGEPDTSEASPGADTLVGGAAGESEGEEEGEGLGALAGTIEDDKEDEDEEDDELAPKLRKPGEIDLDRYTDPSVDFTSLPAPELKLPNEGLPPVFPLRFAPLGEKDPAQEFAEQIDGETRMEAMSEYVRLGEERKAKIDRVGFILGVINSKLDGIRSAEASLRAAGSTAQMPPERAAVIRNMEESVKLLERLPQLIEENPDKSIQELLDPKIKQALIDCNDFYTSDEKPAQHADNFLQFIEAGEFPEAQRARLGKIEIIQHILQAELANIENGNTWSEWSKQAFTEGDGSTAARRQLMVDALEDLEKLAQLAMLNPEMELQYIIQNRYSKIKTALAECSTGFKEREERVAPMDEFDKGFSYTIPSFIDAKGNIVGKDPQTMGELQDQYNLLITKLREQKDYVSAQRIMEDKVLAQYFSAGVKRLSNEAKRAAAVTAGKEASEAAIKYEDYWRKEVEKAIDKEHPGMDYDAKVPMIDAYVLDQKRAMQEEIYDHRLKEEAGKYLYASNDGSTDSKIIEQYNDMLDPHEEYFNLKDSTWDTIIEQVAINVPLIALSGGVASVVRGGCSLAARAILSSTRFASAGVKLASKLGLAVQMGANGGLRGGRILVGTGTISKLVYGTGRATGLLIEGAAFEATHMGLQGEWIGNQPDWMKRILISSATLGTFKLAGKAATQANKGLDKLISKLKLKDPKMARSIRHAATHISLETATMMAIGAATHYYEKGSMEGYDATNELFHALLMVGALKVSAKGSQLVLSSGGVTLATLTGKLAARASKKLTERYEHADRAETALSTELATLRAERAKFTKRAKAKRTPEQVKINEAREARIKEIEADLGKIGAEKGKLTEMDTALKEKEAIREAAKEKGLEEARGREKQRMEEFVKKERARAQKRFDKINELMTADPVTGEISPKKLKKAKKLLAEAEAILEGDPGKWIWQVAGMEKTPLPETPSKAEFAKDFARAEGLIRGVEAAHTAMPNFDPAVLKGTDVAPLKEMVEEYGRKEAELQELLSKELPVESKAEIQRTLDALARNKKSIQDRVGALEAQADLKRQITESQSLVDNYQAELTGLRGKKGKDVTAKRKELQQKIREEKAKIKGLEKQNLEGVKVEEQRLAEEERLRTEESTKEELRQAETREALATEHVVAAVGAKENPLMEAVALESSARIGNKILARILRRPLTQDSISAGKVAKAKQILKEMDSLLEAMPEGAAKGELIGKVEGFRQIVKSREILLEANKSLDPKVLESNDVGKLESMEAEYARAEASLREITGDTSLSESARAEVQKVQEVLTAKKEAINQRIVEVKAEAVRKEQESTAEIFSRLGKLKVGDVIISKSGNKRLILESKDGNLVILLTDPKGVEVIEYAKASEFQPNMIKEVAEANPETVAKATAAKAKHEEQMAREQAERKARQQAEREAREQAEREAAERAAEAKRSGPELLFENGRLKSKAEIFKLNTEALEALRARISDLSTPITERIALAERIFELQNEGYSKTDVQKIHRRLMTKYHPDKNPGHQEASTIMAQAINSARELLDAQVMAEAA